MKPFIDGDESGGNFLPVRDYDPEMARSGPAIVLSLVVHAAVLGGLLVRSRDREPGSALPELRSFAPAVTGRFRAARRAIELREERAAAVREARAGLAAGHLKLGAFLLETGRIDAEAGGIELDGALAGQRYAERLSALRAALAKGDGVAAAVPKVFGDLKYHGRPGGLMASALVDGGGSCEQVTQLVAAAVYDAGRSGEIGLRLYGGVMADGAAHVTPVAITKDGEIDLMTGLPPVPGGVRISAEELVEVYARAHGLAPPLRAEGSRTGGQARAPGGDGAAGEARKDAPARPTLLAGFPKNDDRFPGSLPLYASRAIRDPARDPAIAGDAESNDLEAKHCAYFLRIAMLSPPSIEIVTGGASGIVSVEPRRVPPPLRLEREAVLLRAAETAAQQPDAEPVDRLMSWACLAVLGDTAAVDLALAGEHALAAEAVEAGKRGRANGKTALGAIAWSGEEGVHAAKKLAIDYGGRTWILLALQGGDQVVFDLVSRSKRDDWGRINALGALVVWGDTRERALGFVSTLPLADQVDVMHEVYHAHDHMRPWASPFDLDDTVARPGSDAQQFLTAYRVFRGLAWRLWDGNRPVEEALAALESEARAAGLDGAWEAALLRYFANNVLGLYSQRQRGKEVVTILRAAVAKNPHASLDPLRHSLAYLEQQGELNARTVADAMRLR